MGAFFDAFLLFALGLSVGAFVNTFWDFAKTRKRLNTERVRHKYILARATLQELCDAGYVEEDSEGARSAFKIVDAVIEHPDELLMMVGHSIKTVRADRQKGKTEGLYQGTVEDAVSDFGAKSLDNMAPFLYAFMEAMAYTYYYYNTWGFWLRKEPTPATVEEIGRKIDIGSTFHAVSELKAA